MSIPSPSSNAISKGLETADTLLHIADAFRELGEFQHELLTYRRVNEILDKVEQVLGESRGASNRQAEEILYNISARRTRSLDGERNHAAMLAPDCASADTR